MPRLPKRSKKSLGVEGRHAKKKGSSPIAPMIAARLPLQIAQAIAVATETGHYMLAAWSVAEGRVDLVCHRHEFPFGDFVVSKELLASELDRVAILPGIPRKLILKCSLSPGDVLVMTVAIESLHATYPGQYLTDVRTPVAEIWQGNPWITPIPDDDPEATTIHMEYPQIHRSNQSPVNFVTCYTEYLGEQLDRRLYATVNRPQIYLSDEEKSWMTMPQEHFHGGRKVPYAVLVAGTKNDYTIKQWPVEYYQEVIDRTLGVFQWVQVGESNHNHHPLERCINLVGKTSHRMLHRLIYHAKLGLGPVTYLMHLCAAFEVPYIYIAGGREPVTFLSYPKQHTLHTIGALPCCQSNACWRSRVVPLHDGDEKDNNLCEYPIVGLKMPVAKCMAMITPDEVVRMIQSYGGLSG